MASIAQRLRADEGAPSATSSATEVTLTTATRMLPATLILVASWSPSSAAWAPR